MKIRWRWGPDEFYWVIRGKDRILAEVYEAGGGRWFLDMLLPGLDWTETIYPSLDTAKAEGLRRVESYLKDYEDFEKGYRRKEE